MIAEPQPAARTNGPCLILIAAVMIGAAGVLHLILAPLHWSHAPVHGIVLATAGIAELTWAARFWRRPSVLVHQAGGLLAGGLITLWAVTRFLPVPSGHGPEATDSLGVLCKVTETLGIAALLAPIISQTSTASQRRAAWRMAGALLTAPLFVGWMGYATALAVEPTVERLLRPALHHHEGETTGHTPTGYTHDATTTGPHSHVSG